MKKLVFLSNIPAPYQVKYCYSLQNHFDTYFLFYERIGNRPEYWKIDLGVRCIILKSVLKFRGLYMTFSHLSYLKKINPDIIMLGGFSIPANWIAYLWGIYNKKKIVMYTERSRTNDGQLRVRGIRSKIIEFLYKRIDLLLVTAEDAIPQYRDIFKWKFKILHLPYASDIDNYYDHPYRSKKDGYTYIFANRLIDIYNPILALEIFKQILRLYPKSKLKLCADGDLKEECVNYINNNSLNNSVSFLSDIRNWAEIGDIYRNSDILLLPAKFSNGNFTVLEAQASGMGIVISNRVLGTNNIRGGFVCEPTVDAFIEKILMYINNSDLFEKHAIINREDVFQYGSIAVAKQTKELFESELF